MSSAGAREAASVCPCAPEAPAPRRTCRATLRRPRPTRRGSWPRPRASSSRYLRAGYHARLVVVWRHLTVLAVFLLAAPVAAEWRIEGHFGTAWNVPSTLTLRQDGQPPLRLDAHWETQPLRAAPYY